MEIGLVVGIVLFSQDILVLAIIQVCAPDVEMVLRIQVNNVIMEIGLAA